MSCGDGICGMTRKITRLGRAFVANLPDDGAMFAPEVVRCDAEGLDIKFHRCPLKQAWLDANLAQEEVATLCRIAAQVDSGMFEGAGFRFHADTYRPGAEGCCFLHVRAPNSGRGKARRTFPAQRRISASPASSVNTYPYFCLGGVNSLPAHPMRT